MYTQWCAFGRGTAVYLVRDSQDQLRALKISRPYAARPHEHVLLEEARQAVGDGVPAVFGHGAGELVSDGERRHLMPVNAEQDRRLHMLLMEVLIPLKKLSGVQYLDAWVEIAQNLKNLYDHGILHRDISSNNLMYRQTGTTIQGVVTDFDLATSFRKRVHYPARLLHRTGTTPFLARELLERGDLVPHLLRHDLESAFYVLIWDAVDKVAPGAAENARLQKWLDPTTSADAKGAVATHLREPTLVPGLGIPLGKMDPIRKLLITIAIEIYLGYGQLLGWLNVADKLRTELEGDEKKNWECLWGHFVPEVMVQKFQELKQGFAQSQEGESNS
ncbi:hypothetical protein BOTBODRAFT_496257 [Botryobasidium botryosum FD-172 SS1]|uniref:Protein kinase domain-containing protein n=1 Tax=Botryobasidium botryosum (strain FD-172 SS1) TaxID=930990 RepID=A0A067M4F9_BOTB1|nr:hypothetical protein BOTBODRAFT_496257 [Botryobasidium botryosum FD-172 SS1]